MVAVDDEYQWMAPGCRHEWKLGPVTDRLMRRRPAVCVRCWAYNEGLAYAVWSNYEVWTPEHAEKYAAQVEEHFG